MGKAPSPPQPTDPKVSSAADQHAQTGTAIANAWMGNPQEYGPTGSLKFERTGTQYTRDAQGNAIEIPTFSRTITLSPEEQANYEAQSRVSLLGFNAAEQNLNTLNKRGTFTPSAATQFDMTAPEAPQYSQVKDWNQDNYEGYRQRALDTYKSYMQPELDRQYDRRMTELQNQGITRGSDAYDTARQQADRSLSDANLQMVMQAGSEADRARGIDEGNRADYLNQVAYNNGLGDRTFGNEMDRVNFKNSLAQQQYAREANEYSMPLNELGAVMGAGQVNIPQFESMRYTPIKPTDVAGQYNHYDQMQMQNYQARLQAYQAKMSGLFGLGSAAIGGLFRMSDRRLKRDVVRVGSDPRGFDWYEFQYVWGGPREVGVMADEIAKVLPSAVLTLPDGFQAVDYGAL